MARIKLVPAILAAVVAVSASGRALAQDGPEDADSGVILDQEVNVRVSWLYDEVERHPRYEMPGTLRYATPTGRLSLDYECRWRTEKRRRPPAAAAASDYLPPRRDTPPPKTMQEERVFPEPEPRIAREPSAIVRFNDPLDISAYGLRTVSTGPVEQLGLEIAPDDISFVTLDGEELFFDLDLGSTGVATEISFGPVSIIGRWIVGKAETSVTATGSPGGGGGGHEGGGGGGGSGGTTDVDVDWDYEQYYLGLSIPIVSLSGDPFLELGIADKSVVQFSLDLKALGGWWYLRLDSGEGSASGGSFPVDDSDLDGPFFGGEITLDCPISPNLMASFFSSVVRLDGDAAGTAFHVGFTVGWSF